MDQTLNIQTLDHPDECRDFFQQTILSGLHYWENHQAIQQLDVQMLDREREGLLNALHHGLDFSPAWPRVSKLIEALASFMERRGYWAAWRTVLEKAVAASQHVEDIHGEATMTALLARLSQRQSRGEDVVRFYRRVMHLAKQSDNQYEYARACCNLGHYYIDAGRWWRSEVLSTHALNIFEALESDHGRAHSTNHLGLLYIQKERWNEAEASLRIACQLWEKTTNNPSLIPVYINLGIIYIKTDRNAQALAILTSANRIAVQAGDIIHMGKIWNNMAVAYRQDKKWTSAEQYARKAELEFEKHLDNYGLASVWQTLSVIYSNLGQKSIAIDHFNKALAMRQRLQDRTGEENLRKISHGLAILS